MFVQASLFLLFIRLSCAFPIVNCHEGSCEIEVIEGNKFFLVEEENSIFSRNLKIHHNGIIETKFPELGGKRYNTRTSESYWGSALIQDNTIVQGVFLTKDQGVIEFNRDEKNQLRKLEHAETGHDIALEFPIEQQFWKKFEYKDTSRILAESEMIRFTPGCFPDDSAKHVFKMNLVVDVALFDYLTASIGSLDAKKRKLQQDIESMFSVGKLLFLSQLGIRLSVENVVIGTNQDPVPLSRGQNECIGALAAFDEFKKWKNSRSDETGYWMLLSNCFRTITGVSYIGAICGSSNTGVSAFSWLVVFHELGHGFGMSHSFENGVGSTGGLMDYGDGRFNGIVQFHPNKMKEVCPFLTYIKQAHCPYFQLESGASICGDGVLDEDEQCECLQTNLKSCGKCVDCNVIDTSVECSSADFVFRTPLIDKVAVVQHSALASSECCRSNKLAPPKTLCGTNKLNACGSFGQCVPICTALLLPDNPNCGFDTTGCMLGCVWKGVCRWDFLNHFNNLLSALPDGSPCILSGKVGSCSNGVCVQAIDIPINDDNDDEKTPKSSPTAQPSPPTLKPTPPTPKPTPPTLTPTIPTSKPTLITSEPTLPTRKPTPPTSRPLFPTFQPTPPTFEPTPEPTVPTNEPTRRTKRPRTSFPTFKREAMTSEPTSEPEVESSSPTFHPFTRQFTRFPTSSDTEPPNENLTISVSNQNTPVYVVAGAVASIIGAASLIAFVGRRQKRTASSHQVDDIVAHVAHPNFEVSNPMFEMQQTSTTALQSSQT